MARSPMSPRSKRIAVIAACGFVFLFIGGACGVGYSLFALLSSDPDSPSNQASAMKCVIEWGRLAPFPADARCSKIKVEGSMFTRGFRASFVAPPDRIDAWLAASPGTKESKPTFPRPGIRNYVIKPEGGADHAEVTVDDAEHRVTVYVYWS